MSYISRLRLHEFRCYEQLTLSDLSGAPVILHGANGAGKTNILEAVSMLVPGRGLRGVKIGDMQRIGSQSPWAVAASVYSEGGESQIGTGADQNTEKRLVRINGETARSQTMLADYLSCVWLTPQMDRLFLEGASVRRRFLDRLVFSFDPSHSGRVTRYDNAMRQRARLLQETRHPDPLWLKGLEQKMAETGIAISAARLDFVNRLQQAAATGHSGEERSLFPQVRLQVTGTLESLLMKAPALEVEDMFLYQLEQSREKDSMTGGAVTGAHKSDLYVMYDEKNMPADQCSTGEQKALLIGIILAHGRLIRAERGAPPLLLLDEVAAHLDDRRRHFLHGVLADNGGQVWLTGTDITLFDDLKQTGQFFHIHQAALAGQARPDAA